MISDICKYIKSTWARKSNKNPKKERGETMRKKENSTHV